MKPIIFIAMLLMLTGCGKVSRFVAVWTGEDIVCVEGVKYVQFSSGASVLYNQDGTVRKCDD